MYKQIVDIGKSFVGMLQDLWELWYIGLFDNLTVCLQFTKSSNFPRIW